jgi:hypothetical protein
MKTFQVADREHMGGHVAVLKRVDNAEVQVPPSKGFYVRAIRADGSPSTIGFYSDEHTANTEISFLKGNRIPDPKLADAVDFDIVPGR